MRLPALPAITCSTIAMLAGAGLSIALPAVPAAAQQWREINCSSRNFREASCPVPRAQRVQLLRVLGGQCIEGQTWIHDNDVIRVRNGCRAIFRIDANSGWGVGGWDPNQGNWGNNAQVRRVRCESWNYRDANCPVPGNIRGVRLTRVIAGDCRDGATWRWNRRAVTVRNGCRADFDVLLGANGWQGGNQGGFPGGGVPGAGGRPLATINCQSFNYRQEVCAIPRASFVRVSRVLGGNCQEGTTWRWVQGRITVNGGCRAAFDIY